MQQWDEEEFIGREAGNQQLYAKSTRIREVEGTIHHSIIA